MDITTNLEEISESRFIELNSPDEFTPSASVGIHKYGAEIGLGARLDSLFVNKRSDVLVVSLHGATQRSTISVPRFERLRTFLKTPYSSIYFGDPALYLDQRLSLAWYTGWTGTDVPSLIASWVTSAAKASGAAKIVFVGSSGGGFAAAQISSLVPGSVAVAFNPQTVISAYRPNGSLGHGRRYVEVVRPELAPRSGIKSLDPIADWAEPMAERGSLINRYNKPTLNRLLYVQNDRDYSHWSDHYTPFRNEVATGPNNDRVRFHIYSGPEGHSAPPREVFDAALSMAIDWNDTVDSAAEPAPISAAHSRFRPLENSDADERESTNTEASKQRDRHALNRAQLLEDYSAISAKRPGAAEATTLRERSRQFLDILAFEASCGQFDWALLRAQLLHQKAIEKYELDPLVVAEIGRILLLQQFEPIDSTVGVAALEYATTRLPMNFKSRRFRKLLVSQLILSHNYTRSRELLDTWPDVDREYHNYLRAELVNPFFVHEGGDLESWLQNLNRDFEAHGLSRIHVDHHGGVPFNELRGEAEPLATTAAGSSAAPKVTVILTTYKPSLAKLSTSVRSILCQTYRNIEVVIVDDASGPQYSETMDVIGAMDERVRIVAANENGGTYRARNIGLSVASGYYVTGQDDDDWSHPQRIAEQVAFLNARSDVIGCRVDSLNCTENLNRVRLGYKPISGNASSLMLRRETFEGVGGFMEARKGADTELRRRVEKLYGLPVVDIDKPLAIIRIGADSLSRGEFQPGWSHPARRAFQSSYGYWHAEAHPSDLVLRSEDSLSVFIPYRFRSPGTFSATSYEVVFAGDWHQYGGPQKSMLEEIRALTARGLRVGIMQLEAPRFMSKAKRQLIPQVQALVNNGTVGQLMYDDPVEVELLILRYPPILQFAPYRPSSLKVHRMVILANQAPSELDGSDIRYLVPDCTANARRMFTKNVLWIPQGPQVRAAIEPYLMSDEVSDFDLPGILAPDEWFDCHERPRSVLPVVGRHSRDTSMKWPEDPRVLEEVYPTSGRLDIRILGGASAARSVLGVDVDPAAWTVYAEDVLPVRSFLSTLDFFVFFQHSVAVEAFGRAILEAIAAGLVVVLPPHFREVFGEAAVYAEPSGVQKLIARYHGDRSLYYSQVQKAQLTVERRFSHNAYCEVIEALLGVGGA